MSKLKNQTALKKQYERREIFSSFKYSIMNIFVGDKIEVTLKLGENKILSTLSGQVSKIFKDSLELTDTRLNKVEIYINQVHKIKKLR